MAATMPDDGGHSVSGGVVPGQIGSLSATAASGLQESCIVATGTVWGSLQASAAAALTGDACSGFQASAMSSVSPVSFGSFSKACAANLAGGSYGACAGFTSSQVSPVPGLAHHVGPCASCLVWV